MLVSVVIPCRNSGPWLESAVRSALDQELPPLEVLCVDDASDDDTANRLDRLEKESGGRMRVLRRNERGGIGAARNSGVEKARGDWIALLDHDDLWLPQKLTRQAEVAAAAPGAVLVHSRCREQKGEDASTRVLMHDWKYMADADPFPYLFLSNYIVPCTVLVHREALNRAGGFDPRLDRHGKDDIDLWLRLAETGGRFAHTEEALAVRRLHGSNFSDDTDLFWRGRFDVLADAFERDRRGPRRLLASEGVLRLLGVQLERAVLGEGGAAPEVWAQISDFAAGAPSMLSDARRAERAAFGGPALAPIVSAAARRLGRLPLHHALECALAARTSLTEVSILTEASNRGEWGASATREVLRRAAESAARAARRAYRRRAEYEQRYGVSITSRR